MNTRPAGTEPAAGPFETVRTGLKSPAQAAPFTSTLQKENQLQSLKTSLHNGQAYTAAVDLFPNGPAAKTITLTAPLVVAL
ncbi:MAG: hypothetical protein V4819_24195 [Verrucomicrobiota bacterium]